MTWMQAWGGYYSGRWFNVPKGSHRWEVRVPRLPEAVFTVSQFDPAEVVEAPTDLYAVERLVWPGFRFPIWVLLAPGVRVPQQLTPYDSSWPNPLVEPRCRCGELEGPILNWSACHLDHCPIHGRWTFPPITPMHVSEQARAQRLRTRGTTRRTT